MYDNMNDQQVRDRLALVEEQRRIAVDLLDSVRSELRLEKQRVTDLVREKTDAEVRLEDAQRALSQAHQRHDNDIATIGERLIEEADRRGWCSEFDEIVDELNGSLFVDLPRRVRDFSVDVRVEVSLGVTVTATTEDEAREIAAREWRDRVDFGSYSYSDAIHEGTTLDSDNFTVEEI